MQALSSKSILAILISIFFIAGFAVIWFNSPWGIGVGYDSIFYLSAADNLFSGFGLSRMDGFGNSIPLTHFPPLYPLLISLLSFISGFATDLSARILAAVLFGLLVGLNGWLVYRYTRSILASVLGAGLILVSPVMLDVSFMAMSELLYLVLMLSFLHLLNQYLLNGRWIELFGSAVFAASAYLTRYVGITAVAAGGLALVIFRPRRVGKIVKDVLLFGTVSLVPMLIFYIRNWSLTGSMTNRIIGFHPPTQNQIRQGLGTISTWLLPDRINSYLRMVVLAIFLIAIAALILWNYFNGKSKPSEQNEDSGALQFTALLAMYAVIYILMVIASLTFFDASTRLNDRILSPLYVLGILIGLITVWNSTILESSKLFRAGVLVLMVVFLGLNLLRGVDTANTMRMEGRGFSGREWRSSETIAEMGNLSPGTVIFSNEAFAIHYLTGISANWIPENFDPVKGMMDEKYDQRIDAMRGQILQQDGALVIFDSINDHNVYAPIEQLAAGLSLWKETADGMIFLHP